MHRYLLFDSGCSQCTEIAQAVEQATQGGLEARSLRDPTMQRLLAQARPHWRWQPALLEVAGDRVRAFTGLAMGLRLMGVLGLRRVWRLAKLVRSIGVPLMDIDWERRQFLKRVSGLLAGMILIPKLVKSQASTQEPDFICYGCRCCTEAIWLEGCCCQGGCCGEQGRYDYCRWHLYTWQYSSCGCSYYCGTICLRVSYCAC